MRLQEVEELLSLTAFGSEMDIRNPDGAVFVLHTETLLLAHLGGNIHESDIYFLLFRQLDVCGKNVPSRVTIA